MARFQPEQETCPTCGSTGNCHIHDYYGRSIIDFRNGHLQKDNLCVMRVFCDSCRHAHAILPDCTIPYSSYSLFFILRLLGEYFAGLYSVERLCEKFSITINQLYKWLSLWKEHKREWLGMLADGETTDTAFLRRITFADSYSSFSMEFIRCLCISFLQSHASPVAAGTKTAHYHQTVFAPDISIF